MTEPRPTVVGVPSDGDATAALRFAVGHAARTGAPLRLVHVYDVVPVGPLADEETPDRRRAEERAGTVLDRAREEAGTLADRDVATELRLVPGAPARGLVEQSVDAGLVVLQRRDHGILGRVLARSTASAVASRAYAPVVVVPSGWRDTGTGVVTVGLDDPGGPGEPGDPAAAGLLRAAAAEAGGRGARLRVVHAVWGLAGLDEILVEKVTADRHRAAAAERVEQQVATVRSGHPGLVVEVDVRHVRPAEALLAASEASDLLVVGRHDPAVPLGSHLGPVAGAVLRESRCPVLVVAPPDPGR